MAIEAMNHFTILTNDLAATTRFYALFGLHAGWRPPFNFPGAWLYAGDMPILHVVLKERLPDRRDGLLDHMAFTARDLRGVVAILRREGCDFDLRRLAGGGVWQLFVRDPSGVRVEFDFSKDELPPEDWSSTV